MKLAADDLMGLLEALSPDELRADIERANRYLASEDGMREFDDLLNGRDATSSNADQR